MAGRGRTIAIMGLMTMMPVLAACGSRAPAPDGTRPGLARDAVPGLAGRRCRFATTHTAVPRFQDIARAGTRGNIGLWGADMEPGDSAVVSVRYGDDGRLVWVRTIQTSLPPERSASLENILLGSLKETGPPDWGVRIRVDGGDIRTMAPSVLCPPEPGQGGPKRAVAMPVTRQDYNSLNNARGRHYPIKVALDERGAVLDVRLERPSGSHVVDQFLIDWILATRFYPKLHDGIALASILEETLFIPRSRR